ncbi:MAG TPA: class II aldolase/adducin family protein [Pseudonocardiaceae bacterium]|nr:class II aldolase/adducin family protein [Pseudonocardiaceae bacterium]
MAEPLLTDLRAAVCELGRRMVADRLVVGTSGNISARAGDLVAVTPTGVPYAELVPGSITVLDLTGRQVAGDLPPTSEVPLHLALYQSRPVGAVVHTHGPHATAVSTLVDEVPPVHYAVGLFGGAIRVAGYARFGSPELAAATLAALGDRTGCLLANHGAVTVGGDLAAAYERALQLEWLCQVWLAARSVGVPRLLPAAEIAEVTERLRGYGAAGREPGLQG